MPVAALLESASRWPNKLAVQDASQRLTYNQLVTFSAAIRRIVLKETTCGRVALMLPASVAGTGTLFGILWAGKVAIPLNFLLQPRELQAVIADAGIDLIITTEYFKALIEQVPVRALYLEGLNLKRRYVWEKFHRTPAPPAKKPDDSAVILYTSGTTGKPKGVCLTHNNFRTNCHAAIAHFRIGPESHLLGLVPPFHVFGLTILNFLPIIAGAGTTFIPRFSPQATYKAIASESISILMAVPSMYGAVARLKSIEPSAFRSVTLAASGGEPLPRTVYEAFHQRTGVRIVEGYGLTETSPVISADLPWAHRVGTVGPPIAGAELQLRDANGQVLNRDQEGELFVRGPMIMKGYYNKPEETAAAIDPNGWFRTGDIVRIDSDGYISITGRAKDLIIVGGENVYPREVENVLEQHPAVQDSAVVGQQDASRGEVVVAFVTLREGIQATAEELRNYCRTHLASFKTPREVIIRPDLPRGPTGKILKRELKAQLSTGSPLLTKEGPAEV